MTFKEKTESLRTFLKGQIKEDMSADELEEYNKQIAGLDELDVEYEKSESEVAKFKDKIVNMVLTQGNDKAPEDEHDGSKPMSMEEAVRQATKGGK